MAEALEQDFPRLAAHPQTEERMALACFGPSLADTWQDIRHPIMTCSGAHDFLIERGIVPDYHVECDPRPHKVVTTSKPHAGCTYLMASCCDPQTWKNLRGQRVYLWHMDNGPETREWLEKNDPMSIILGTGSTVGLRAFHVAGMLGYSKFDVYGMDGNYRDGNYRAGPLDAPPQGVYTYKIKGRKFKTTDQAVNAMHELYGAIQTYGIDVRLHGDSMNKAYLDFFK